MLEMLECRHAVVRDLRAHERQVRQIIEPPKLAQPGVRNLGPAELDRRQALDFGNLLKSCVRNPSTVQAEDCQLFKVTDLLHRCVRDLAMAKVEIFQMLELSYALQVCIRDFASEKENSQVLERLEQLDILAPKPCICRKIHGHYWATGQVVIPFDSTSTTFNLLDRLRFVRIVCEAHALHRCEGNDQEERDLDYSWKASEITGHHRLRRCGIGEKTGMEKGSAVSGGDPY